MTLGLIGCSRNQNVCKSGSRCNNPYWPAGTLLISSSAWEPCYTFYSPRGNELPFYYLCTSLLLKKFNLRAVFWRVLSTGWFGSTSMYVRGCQINNIVISVLHIWRANCFHYRESCNENRITLLVSCSILDEIAIGYLKKQSCLQIRRIETAWSGI